MKVNKVEAAAILNESRLFETKDIIKMKCPALNVALNGELKGGMVPGILQIAAPSKSFKSKFALEIASEFMNKFPEGIVIFYDTEFGTPEAYFGDMDQERIFHKPLVNIEEWKVDIMAVLRNSTEKDRLLIIVDSLGNMPSVKEIEDADKGSDTQDMTRAKQITAVFRMISPRINLNTVYMIVVNHVYESQEARSYGSAAKLVPKGGTSSVYNSNIIWTITKAQEKDAKDLIGYQFTLKCEKSRFIKETSKIPITVEFSEGIYKWSAILDWGIESGLVIRPTAQKYALKWKPDEHFTMKDLEKNDSFYQELVDNEDFNAWIKSEFQYSKVQ